MLQTFRNAWRIEELRKKILFTLLIILLYRLGNAVPVPFVDTALLQQYFDYNNLQNTVVVTDIKEHNAAVVTDIFNPTGYSYVLTNIVFSQFSAIYCAINICFCHL